MISEQPETFFHFLTTSSFGPRRGRWTGGASRSCRRRTWLCVWLRGEAWRSLNTWAGSWSSSPRHRRARRVRAAVGERRRRRLTAQVTAVVLLKGQQTFSEEVSERTRSRLLKLEKENQSLLRTIEELSTKSKPNHLLSSSAEESLCTENSEPLMNGGSNYLQDGERNLLPETTECRLQESGQLQDGGAGKDFQESMLDLEVLENIQNGLHCLDGQKTPNRSSLRHDSVLTVLPARSSYASKHTQRLEAKVRALDAVNLQLQTSLDSAGEVLQAVKNVHRNITRSLIFFSSSFKIEKCLFWRRSFWSWRQRTTLYRPP